MQNQQAINDKAAFTELIDQIPDSETREQVNEEFEDIQTRINQFFEKVLKLVEERM